MQNIVHQTTSQVDGTVHTWKLMLRHMYPLFAPAAPALEEVAHMLSLAHKVCAVAWSSQAQGHLMPELNNGSFQELALMGAVQLDRAGLGPPLPGLLLSSPFAPLCSGSVWHSGCSDLARACMHVPVLCTLGWVQFD